METLKNQINEDFSQMIDTRFDEMVSSAKRRGSKIIESKDFFMKVIHNYFEAMGKAKTNKCLNSYTTMCREMNRAVEKAEYACAKPARIENAQYFN